MNISTAIIPVAGWGTRRLPITKTIEKCMLPVGNRPIVDYVVADCVAAGVSEIYFVVGEESNQIREYFGHNKKLEKYLRAKGKTADLEQIQPPVVRDENGALKKITFHFIEQPQNEKYGTTIPVALALAEIAKSRGEINEPILVMMGDDFLYYHDKKISGHVPRMEILRANSDFKKMVTARESDKEAAMLGVEIPRENVDKYGVISFMENARGDKIFREIVEKPSITDAPSNLINISKYVFPPDLLKLIQKYARDEFRQPNGEFHITDPINEFVRVGGIMKVVMASGEYLDGGNLAGWLHANEVVGKDLL